MGIAPLVDTLKGMTIAALESHTLRKRNPYKGFPSFDQGGEFRDEWSPKHSVCGKLESHRVIEA